jgi:uncharacterized protein YbjT (DUF2867 family)
MIAVVGGTGQVGRPVAAQLTEAGFGVRVISRGTRPASVPQAETAVADLASPDSLEPHLRDVSALFLPWPFTSAELTAGLAPKVAGLIARHVPRIVYLSAEPAASRPDSFWALVEQAIEASGAEWTFLRPTGFASNTLAWADQIRAGDVVRWPFGTARRALIDERDIAAVAVRALTTGGHTGARYLLTGLETLTQAEQLAAIGAALGRDLTWQDLPPDEAVEMLAATWGDRAFARQAVTTWSRFTEHPETVNSTVRDLTGTPAHSFADWAATHAAAFR